MVSHEPSAYLPSPHQQPLREGRRAKIVRLLEARIEKNNLKIILLTAAMQKYVNN